jgi:ketosteroid isomerase-like protein
MTPKWTLAALVVFALTSGSVLAQPASADEAAIRDLIARLDSGEAIAHTEDSIFWSGAFKQPVVGREKPVPIQGSAERVGPAKSRTTVRRIDVSQSRDLAYEFSDAELTVQEKRQDGQVQTRRFSNSSLRVWKKVNDEWQLAAYFGRPHEP